jgi:hypothetical protein
MNASFGLWSDLLFAREGSTHRVSSADPTGGNRDFWTLRPGETATLAEVQGSGIVRHLWFTVSHPDPFYLRKMVLRAYWDGEEEPSVEVPLGDFFGLGHGIARSFQSLPLNTVTHRDNESCVGGGVALNSYFPMPFRERMRLTLHNESEEPANSVYFYVDYDLLPRLPDSVLLFHAQYRQEFPTEVPGGSLAERGERYWEHMGDANMTGEGNYVILEARGEGHYVGCVLSVENIDPALVRKRVGDREGDVLELTWWGEGDDMIFIDEESTPRLQGTGSEDYFTQAWGMHDRAYLFAGTSIPEMDPRFPHRRVCSQYRFHLLDPVIFHRSIRVTIEHGHANLQRNRYSSVAYWYQGEPHQAFPALPPAPERLPLVDETRWSRAF